MSEVYFVDTPSTGLVVSLAEGKHHLKIDDEQAGAKAAVSFGSGNAQLVLTAKLDGTYANDFTAEVIEDGLNTSLSVSYDAAEFTINLATDGAGVSTSTVNDVIAALLNTPAISQKVTVTHGAGSGTGLLAAATSAPFAGGVDGTSYEDDYVTGLLMAAQGRAETILRKKILTTVMVKKLSGFPCSDNPVTLDYGKVQSVDELNYYDSNGVLQNVMPPYTSYEVDSDAVPALLTLLPGEYWPYVDLDRHYPLNVKFTVGYGDPEDVPAEIKLAIKLMIGHWYSNRENVMVSAGLTAVAIPQGAEDLLWPHRDFRF